MNLSDVLGETRAVATRAVGTTARAAEQLAGSSPVEATGQRAKPRPVAVGPSPAIVATVFALAAIGGLVAMRVAFRGAIS